MKAVVLIAIAVAFALRNKQLRFCSLYLVVFGHAYGQNFNLVASVPDASGRIHGIVDLMCNSSFTRCSVMGDGVVHVIDVASKQLVGDLTVTPSDTGLAGIGQNKNTGMGCALGYGKFGTTMGSLQFFDPITLQVASNVVTLPVQLPRACTWTPDGLYMYITADDDGKQLIKLDTRSWSVVQTWAANPGSAAYDVIAEGSEKDGTDKVFIRTFTPPQNHNVYVAEHDGGLQALDLGGDNILPQSLNVGPTGRVYVSAHKIRAAGGYYPMLYGIDPVTKQVVRTVNDQPDYLAWPADTDEDGAYESFSTGGLRVLNIYSGQRINPFSVDTTTSYGLAAGRQSDGSDLVIIRLEDRLDFYQASPVMYYAAVNIGDWDPAKGLPAGSIGAIFGTHMANCTQAPGVLPLLNSVCGAQVLINGKAAPLYFVSPEQINFEVPSGTADPANLVVQGPSGSADSIKFQAPAFSPSLLSWPAGTPEAEQPLVVHVDGSVDAQVHPGETIILYGTGFGNSSPALPDGAAAPAQPLSKITTNFVVTLAGVPCPVTFAGLAPGFVGLTQLNVQIPAGVPAGTNELLDISASPANVAPDYTNMVSVE